MSATAVSCRRSAFTSRSWVLVLSLLVLPFNAAQVTQTAFIGRWGYAATYLASPPALLIQGGKADASNAYSYTSAPNTDSLLVVPLTSSFSLTTPPVREFTLDAPSYAWHCLVPFGHEQLLLFGGDGGPELAVQTNADSAWVLSAETTVSQISNISATQQATSWASQPTRRIHHSCASASTSDVSYITGGVRNDGSQTAHTNVYAFDGTQFTAMPSLPTATYHHASLLLPNGTLLVLGGIQSSASETSMASLNSLWSLDTSSQADTAPWRTVSIAGSAPEARRGFSMSLSANGSAAVLIGGASRDLGQAYSDTWRLDLGESLGWTQVADDGIARFDHAAVAVGNDQVMLFGGYGASGPVESNLHVFSFASNGYVDAFTPAASGSRPGQQTPGGSAHPMAPGSGGSGEQVEPVNQASGSSDTSSDDSATQPVDPIKPSTPAAAPPDDASKTGHIALRIALGTVSGLLACAAAGVGVIWYRRRMQRDRSQPRRRPPRGAYANAAADPEKDGQGLLTFVGDSHVHVRRDSRPGVRLVAAPRASQVTQQSIPMLQRHLRSVKRVLSTGSRDARENARRLDMLVDEDSRDFHREGWKSAGSLLGSKNGEDPFKDNESSDDDGESLIRPPIRGGPVPTPRLASLSSQNPFDDPALVRLESRQLPDIPPADDPSLLAAQQSSDPASLSSRRSISTGGGSAIIQTAARVSPRKASFVAVKRSDTFLSRLTGGLIGSSSTNQRALDIRDPAPLPELWPLDTADPFGETATLTLNDPRSDSDVSKPPVAFKPMGQAYPGQSMSSLASAQTMRDMVVVQREPTDGTTNLEGWRDEHEISPVDSRLEPSHLREQAVPAADFDTPRVASPTVTTPQASTPSVERNLGDFATPFQLSTPPRATSSLASSQPASPSPSPLFSNKRRPVREIVASLNKRNGSTPPRPRPKTTYEAVRRSQLVVTNPDDDDA